MSPYKLLTGRGLALKLSKVLELNCYFAYGTSGTFNYIYNSFFVDKKKKDNMVCLILPSYTYRFGIVPYF